MKPGSVLFHAPAAAFQSPGGGENQLVQTGKQLEDLGITIRLFSPWLDRLEEARLLHLFGMSREGLELARVAHARGVRVVLSPICWYEPRAIAFLAPNPLQETWDLAKYAVKRVLPRWPSWRRSLLSLADVVLPNSVAEAGQLVRLFATEPSRIRVVPNGVQSTFTHGSPALFRSEYGAGDFVLYVGRIEPRKNVLRLVEAVSSLGLPLVVIGSPPAGYEAYAALCRRAADHDVVWIDALDHDDPLLASAYAAARVFALPSWFETPGLAALEAALAGSAVVVTPFGCTREYFGERVEYARPDRPAQIARAILKSWEAGPDPRLASHVGSRFLWSDVAQRTAEVYDQIAG
jgi:glycosyltransferase involved in cell wall biosynthesis